MKWNSVYTSLSVTENSAARSVLESLTVHPQCVLTQLTETPEWCLHFSAWINFSLISNLSLCQFKTISPCPVTTSPCKQSLSKDISCITKLPLIPIFPLPPSLQFLAVENSALSQPPELPHTNPSVKKEHRWACGKFPFLMERAQTLFVITEVFPCIILNGLRQLRPGIYSSVKQVRLEWVIFLQPAHTMWVAKM